ncbi:Hypothetical predicted protein [Cloeon dipterum]|uniref:Uncharacterized protein n=1 Tax=Cloeon dipterum TaxID=197152 RepID=A0A8S1DRT6_9INSE|nr:Hypothetical predicted protein [Cloeon dipterum]
MAFQKAIKIYVELQEIRQQPPKQWAFIRKKEKPAVLINLKEHCLMLNGDDCRAICREMRLVSQQWKTSQAPLSIEDFWKMVEDVVTKQVEFRKVFSAIQYATNRNRGKLLKKLK